MMGQSGELQGRRVSENRVIGSGRSYSTAGWGEIAGEVVLGDHFERFFEDLPEFDGLVVGREKVVGGILSSTPFDLVDFLLDLQRLQIVELGLM